MIDADLTFRLIEAPISKWCSSGHRAADTFKRTESDNGSEAPTRFFHVIGREIEGCYCEPCVIIATWLAAQKKKGK